MKIWKQKQFSLNTETVQKIDELAETLDRKKSNIVKLAIDEYYNKTKKEVLELGYDPYGVVSSEKTPNGYIYKTVMY